MRLTKHFRIDDPFRVEDTIPDPEWFPFDITVSEVGTWTGYSSGNLETVPFDNSSGSLNIEPGEQFDITLEALYQDGENIVLIFTGDVPDLSDMSLSFDTELLDFISQDSFETHSSEITFGTFLGEIQTDETYAVEFVPSI